MIIFRKSIARFTLLCAFAVASALTSCESNTSVHTTVDTTVVNAGDRALFIVSEGSGANGSLDADLFRTSPVRDTAVDSNILHGGLFDNDIHILGDRAYILENGGQDKNGVPKHASIDMVNADSLTKIGTVILPPEAANKMAQISSTQFLVTQRNARFALIFDGSTASITDSISVGPNAAEVGVLGGKAFVTISPYGQPGTIESIDLGTHQTIRSQTIGSGPESLVIDSVHNQIIVGCTGDYATIPPAIYFLDPATLAIKDSLTDPSFFTVGALSSIVLGDRLYAILGSNVLPIDLGTHAMETPLLASAKGYYKGIYDSRTNQLYLGYAGDFSSPGSVDVYNASTGTLKWSRSAGIAPGHFAFYH